MVSRKKRKGSLLNPNKPGYINMLWKLEKQTDAANQHTRIALSLIRKEISLYREIERESLHTHQTEG